VVPSEDYPGVYAVGVDLSTLTLLAHPGHGISGHPEALVPIAIAALVIPLLVLGVVGRMFWKAAKRDEEKRF
jgi:hypothetical protein